MNRNTVGKYLNEFINRGYVIKEGRYYLVPKTDYYTLIPTDTLKFLLNYVTCTDKIIKLYIALFDLYNQRRSFTMLDLHRILGYNCPNNKPHSKNTAHIRECMMILSEAGLIKYSICDGRNDKGAIIDIYEVTAMRSHVSEMYMKSY